MEDILIITDYPIVGLGISLALHKYVNDSMEVDVKPFDKTNPTGLLKEDYSAVIFCLTTNSADRLVQCGDYFHVPTLVCADIEDQESIKKLCRMRLAGFLNYKSDMAELILAFKIILTGQLYMPKKMKKYLRRSAFSVCC